MLNRYVLVFFICFQFVSSAFVSAQTDLYNLNKLTDEDWLGMTTEQRLDALNTTNNRAQNQTFFGNFNTFQEKYYRWGYDYYEMSDQYENYAFRGFENYNIIEDRRQRWYYNSFGDRLTKMTRNGSIWTETIYDKGTSSRSGPGGYVNSQLNSSARGTSGGIDGIWVARESTKDWAVSAVGAGSLRAKMSPLTLSIPNMNGMVVDFQSQNYKARILNTNRASAGGNVLTLRGAQLHRSFGALTIGANYANMYTIQNTRDGGTDTRGTVSDYAPTPMIYALRVVDDSPQDGDGPTIQNVSITVNGKPRPDIVPSVIIDDLRRDLITAVDSKGEYLYIEPVANSDKPLPFDKVVVEERIPKYLDYMYYSEYMRGQNTDHIIDTIDVDKMKEYYTYASPNEKIQVSGYDYAVYLFDVITINEKSGG